MIESLFPLTLPPGVFHNGTTYQSAGRWNMANLVRFFEGTIRPVGGWNRIVNTTNNYQAPLGGMPRQALAWRDNGGVINLAIGCIGNTGNPPTTKLYVIQNGTLYDITPAGIPATGMVNSGTGSGGAYGAGAYGAGVYQPTYGTGTIVDADVWSLDTFGANLVGMTTVNSTLYVWQNNTGTAAATPISKITYTGSLVTSGTIAANSYTFALTASTLTGTLQIGQQFTIAGVIYTVTADGTASGNIVTVQVTPANGASSITAGTAVTNYVASNVPSGRSVCVTPERFLCVLGANSDPRNIAWASQGTTDHWTPSALNSAGDFDITSNGRLIVGHRSRGETLLFTDVDLWAMTYIGGTLIYSFAQIGDQCGIIAQQAACVVGSSAFWMGKNSFYVYNGAVSPLPSDVADYVFSNLSLQQQAKIWCMPFPQWSEIWWFYPSLQATEIDSYVIYNYLENHWSIGSLSRTCGAPTGVLPNPILFDAQYIGYDHDLPAGQGTRLDANTTTPNLPYVISGPVEMPLGDNVIKIQRVVPDEKTIGQVNLTLYSAFYPATTETPTTVTTTGMAQPQSVRVTARQLRVEFTEYDQTGANLTDWRVGNMRLGYVVGGRR